MKQFSILRRRSAPSDAGLACQRGENHWREMFRYREEIRIGAPLLAACALCWLYVLVHALGAPHGFGPHAHHSATRQLQSGALMWMVMMAAMMLPVIMPAVLARVRVHVANGVQGSATRCAGMFVLGYVAAWSCYSVLAALADGQLQQATLLDAAGRIDLPLAVALLLAAGAFQLTGIKSMCLVREHASARRSAAPAGYRGAFVAGLMQGGWCMACCWALMLLMWVVGTMNVGFMAALTVYMLAERRLAPAHATVVSRACGAVLIACGAGAVAWLWLGGAVL